MNAVFLFLGGIVQGRYGTRNQSALTMKSNGEVRFYERYLDKDRWEENTVTYQIEMTRK